MSASLPNAGRQPERLPAPIDQWESFPPGNVVALDDFSGRPVDGSAEADADARDTMPRNQRHGNLLDLAADTFGAFCRLNSGPLQGHQPPALAVANADLQLRAADFDAEKHISL